MTRCVVVSVLEKNYKKRKQMRVKYDNHLLLLQKKLILKVRARVPIPILAVTDSVVTEQTTAILISLPSLMMGVPS